MPKDENFPIFFHAGQRMDARLGAQGEFQHWFGGSGRWSVQNPPAEGVIHLVLDLDLRDPRLGLTECGFDRLPLFYCFQFEEGFMEYRVVDRANIEVTKLEEDTYMDVWPYEGYPASFPKIPFDLTGPTPSSLEAFGRDVWQGIHFGEAHKFIAVVPPSSLYGAHLWDEDGDFDHISVKFFFDPADGTVRTYTECG